MDIIITSISRFNTSFIVFDMYKKHSFIYILIISILVSFFTQSIYYFIIIFILYYLNKCLRQFVSNKYIIYFVSFFCLYNTNINYYNIIIFIICVLFIYFNPYN